MALNVLVTVLCFGGIARVYIISFFCKDTVTTIHTFNINTKKKYKILNLLLFIYRAQEKFHLVFCSEELTLIRSFSHFLINLSLFSLVCDTSLGLYCQELAEESQYHTNKSIFRYTLTPLINGIILEFVYV